MSATLHPLGHSRSTRNSQATYCPWHSVTLPAQTLEIRKRLLTLSLAKPRQNAF